MKERVKFDDKRLNDYCSENSIIITNNLPDIITRETILEGKCITCDNTFNKTFRAMIKFGAYCKQCSNKIKVIKFKNTCNKKYGEDNPKKVKEFIDKGIQTNLNKYNVTNPMKCELFKKKQKETMIKNHDVEYPLQNKSIMQKVKKTNMERYDKKNPAQVEEFKEKMKKTSIERYNVDHPMKSPIVKEILKKSTFASQGGYTFNVPELMVKVNKTMMERYNVENPMHCEKFKEKIKETCNKRYGTDHPMQNKEIMEKSIKSSYKLKSYTLPSGKIIKYQGYENFALDDLLKIYNEDDLVNGSKNVPELWYEADGVKHRHYVDIFIPNENKCIEVKSTFTVKIKKDHVFDKQNYAKQEGYVYEIWVYDNGKCIEVH